MILIYNLLVISREAFKLDDFKIRKWKGIEIDVSRDMLEMDDSILVIMRTALLLLQNARTARRKNGQL